VPRSQARRTRGADMASCGTRPDGRGWLRTSDLSRVKAGRAAPSRPREWRRRAKSGKTRGRVSAGPSWRIGRDSWRFESACVTGPEGDGLSALVRRLGHRRSRLLGVREGGAAAAVFATGAGWPREFVEALNAYRRFEPWPAPDEGAPETFRAALSFRVTDRVVTHTRRPLSVSTDRLGVTATRCAYLLHRWPAVGERSTAQAGGSLRSIPPGRSCVGDSPIGLYRVRLGRARCTCFPGDNGVAAAGTFGGRPGCRDA
jgi:hypothetical protein